MVPMELIGHRPHQMIYTRGRRAGRRIVTVKGCVGTVLASSRLEISGGAPVVAHAPRVAHSTADKKAVKRTCRGRLAVNTSNNGNSVLGKADPALL
jgi:hypothetical protein